MKVDSYFCQILQDCDWNRKFKNGRKFDPNSKTGNTFMALKSIIRKITLNQKGGNLAWIQKPKTNEYKGNVWSITQLSFTDHISNLSTKLKNRKWFLVKLYAILFQLQ